VIFGNWPQRHEGQSLGRSRVEDQRIVDYEAIAFLEGGGECGYFGEG